MNKFYPEGVLFSRPENQKAIKDPVIFSEAVKSGRILEARASLCDFKHDLYVDMPAMKGVIPREEGALGISDGSVRDIALISRVNHPVCFTVEDIITKDGAPLAVLSRKKAQAACMREFIDFFTPGDVIDAAVTHLEPFGAFCDIGCGIVALLPVDCISVSRIFHPKDRFFVGQSIKAVIKSKEADGKINLTHKELLGTWKQNAALFSQGETVSGLIRTVESYGSFVELTPNLAGLAEPKGCAVPGNRASVFIKNILPDKMKVKLIIIDCFEADYPAEPAKYFIESGHISRWNYSPAFGKKQRTLKHGKSNPYYNGRRTGKSVRRA